MKLRTTYSNNHPPRRLPSNPTSHESDVKVGSRNSEAGTRGSLHDGPSTSDRDHGTPPIPPGGGHDNPPVRPGRPGSPPIRPRGGHDGPPVGGGHRGFMSLASTDTRDNEPVEMLIPVEIASIYSSGGHEVNLPERMAWCTPDMFTALVRLDAEIHKRGGRLVLSDLFRTYDMQLQAHLDWKTGKKSAYSPPPGESMHEAGRAFDLDLGKLGVELPEFWKIARACGLEPIIAEPDSSASEAWHFDCRGSHDFVYKHYIGLPSPNMKPYTAMSVSAVLALGGRVDRFVGREDAAAIQCMLIRLAFDPGLVDGAIGTQTRKALTDAGVTWADPVSMRRELDAWTHAAFPMEYQSAPSISTFDHDPPEHLVP